MKYILLFFLAIGFHNNIVAQDSLSESGRILIQSNIGNHYLIIDNDFENAIKITNEDTVYVPIGRHTFKLASPFKNDITFSEEIKPDTLFIKKITLLSYFFDPQFNSYPSLHWKANLMVNSENGAEIFIDQKKVGTSFLSVQLDGGIHTIKVQNGKYSNSRKVNILTTKLQVLELSTLPVKRKALALSVIPGASQFYKEQNIKGTVLGIGFLSLLTSSIILDKKFNKSDQDFIKYRELYRGSINPNEIFSYAILAEESLDESQKYYRFRNRAVFLTGLTYMLSLTDGILSKPKRGFFEPWNFDPYFDYRSTNPLYYGIKVSREF